MSERVERLAADLRTDDPRGMHDAAITLSQESTTGRALELLGRATALNQSMGARTHDRVALEPDGKLVITNPYLRNAEVVQTCPEPYVPPCEPENNCRPDVILQRPVYRDLGQPIYRDESQRVYEPTRPRVEYRQEEQPSRALIYGVAGAAAGATLGRNHNEVLRNGVVGAIIGGVVGDITDQNNRK